MTILIDYDNEIVHISIVNEEPTIAYFINALKSINIDEIKNYQLTIKQ